MASTCPNCSEPRSFGEAVCRHCRFHFDAQRVISVEPPRASSPPRSVGARPLVRRPYVAPSRRVLMAAGLVPGLGHLLKRDFRQGIVFLYAVSALVALGGARVTSGLGVAIFGLGGLVHAHSLYDLSPARISPDSHVRMAGSVAIHLGLLILYVPLYFMLIQQERAIPWVAQTQDSWASWLAVLLLLGIVGLPLLFRYVH